MKRKTLPHNPKYPLKSFRVIEHELRPFVTGDLTFGAPTTWTYELDAAERFELAKNGPIPKPRGSYFAKKDGEK